MNAIPLTQTEVAAFVDELKTKINAGYSLTITANWKYTEQKDNVAIAVLTWSGVPALAPRTRTRSDVVVKWAENVDEPEAYISFPSSNVTYFALDVTNEQLRMVGERVNATELRSSAAHLSDAESDDVLPRQPQPSTAPPVPVEKPFTIGDVSTWTFLDGETDSFNTIQVLLYQRLGLSATSPDSVKQQYKTLLTWCGVCLQTEDWRKLLAPLGNEILRGLRTTAFAERGGNVAMLLGELHLDDDPNDVFAAKVAKVEAETKKTAANKKHIVCYVCKRPGHYATNCNQRMGQAHTPQPQMTTTRPFGRGNSGGFGQRGTYAPK
jgi:hypothetical protein